MLHQVQILLAMCTDACRKRITSTITIDYGKFILMMFIAEMSFKLCWNSLRYCDKPWQTMNSRINITSKIYNVSINR